MRTIKTYFKRAPFYNAFTGGFAAFSRAHVPRRRYMLLLREFLEPHIVHIRIILKYASIQGFIQVLWPTKLYYALCIELVALLADRGE